MLDITHFDILALRSSPLASLPFRYTTGLLAYTHTFLSIIVVISFVVFSTLSLNRGIVDGGNFSFCQCSRILVAEPV